MTKIPPLFFPFRVMKRQCDYLTGYDYTNSVQKKYGSFRQMGLERGIPIPEL
jgi:hypothetical protein